MPPLNAFERRLVQEGVVDPERLDRAKQQAEQSGAPLLDVLSQTGVASAESLYESLASFSDLRYVRPSRMDIPKELAESVQARFVHHYRFVPVAERNGTLVIAVSDPLNGQLLDDIRLNLKRRIEPVVATPDEITKAIKGLYGVGADTMERIVGEAEAEGHVVSLDDMEGGQDLGDEKIDASIIKFVNELLMEAIEADATDAHIEPFEDQLRVRYRVDGVLHVAPTPPSVRGFHAAIVSRIKIMASLNIAERRHPQDGKIRARLRDEEFDLRVSILPTPYGETVNIRFLNRASMSMTLEELGLDDSDLEKFDAFLQRPHGMILVTGPTGSGKTTTLYASLAKLNDVERKIITIEDPIEYQLKGISQMQVMPQVDFTFSTALRYMLRHDPDIMLVGEIRDHETAEMAVQASLTGHLVLSTLHTNDAAGAVTRMIDIGVEPFLISSVVIASVAQRLVRCVCPDCAEDYEPERQELRSIGASPEEAAGARFRKGAGCEACRYTGYRGRVAIYEILPFTNAVKELTNRQAAASEIKRRALEQGMRTLRQAGWSQVKRGRTTIEEVLRVTADSDSSDELDAVATTNDAQVPV